MPDGTHDDDLGDDADVELLALDDGAPLPPLLPGLKTTSAPRVINVFSPAIAKRLPPAERAATLRATALPIAVLHTFAQRCRLYGLHPAGVLLSGIGAMLERFPPNETTAKRFRAAMDAKAQRDSFISGFDSAPVFETAAADNDWSRGAARKKESIQ